MTNPSPPVTPPDLPVDTKAGWWCWPAILISLGMIIGTMLGDRPPTGTESAPTRPDGARLALFQIQAKMVIGSASLDPKLAQGLLEELQSTATDADSRAAVSLLQGFLLTNQGKTDELASLRESLPQDPSQAQELTLVSRALSQGLNEAERERLRGRLGWFADLAPGPDLTSSPKKATIVQESFVTMTGLSLVGSAGACLLLVGAALLMAHLFLLKKGHRRHAFDRSTLPAGVMLECFAWFMVLMSVGQLLSAYVESAALVGYLASFIWPLIWPKLRGISWRRFRLSLGLHRGKGIWREVGAGFVGYLGLLAMAAVGIMGTLLLIQIVTYGQQLLAGGEALSPAEAEPHPIVDWINQGDLTEKLLSLLLAAVIAPITEEILFRGALHRHLRRRAGFLTSALIASVIFAALHPQGLLAIPALTAMGIGFSLIREWRDSLIAPMVAHSINNGVLVLLLWLAL